MARIVALTNSARRCADDSRPVIVPWTHGLQSLDKQTASLLTSLAAQAVRFAASKSIALQGEQFRHLWHVEGVQQECCANKDANWLFLPEANPMVPLELVFVEFWRWILTPGHGY